MLGESVVVGGDRPGLAPCPEVFPRIKAEAAGGADGPSTQPSTIDSDPGAVRISLDKRATWGEPDPRLTSVSSLLAQLFHDRSSEPMSRAPIIRLDRGASTMASDILKGAAANSPTEFAIDGFALPDAVLAYYSRQPGSARIDQKLHLFSRSVLDLRIETAAIFYDPFAATAAGA